MVQVKRPNAGTDKIGFAARSICEAGRRLAWDEHAGQLCRAL